MNDNMTDIEPEMTERAVVYQGDMADEFPVLKAFQQYIDAEQAKARKRMILLCLFFSIILMIVIGVFVSLLVASSSRNQTLNDRLVEYAMKDRERAASVVQASTDEPLLRALSDKLENLQKAFVDDRERLEKKVTEEISAAKEKKFSAERLEIERLKTLLAAEKEKASAEREKQRQAELESYRRKHYPECYTSTLTLSPSQRNAQKSPEEEERDTDREIEEILKDVKAIRYFNEDEDDAEFDSFKGRKKEMKNVAPSKGDVEMSNGIKDASGNIWSVPEE